MDLLNWQIVPDPFNLTPRKIMAWHLWASSARRRDIAMEAHSMMLACAAGFNGGDCARSFRKHINVMMARPVMPSSMESQPSENLTDYEESSKAADELAQKLMNLNSGENK